MHLSRLLLGAALLIPFACDSGDQPKIGLPPARAADGADAPKVPGPPPRPEQGPAAAAPTASAAGRYVATALPKHSADLSPRMSGTLTDVMVEEGERVKKGQLLFRLDARASRLGIAQAEASLQGATIQRDNAQRELERQQRLAQSGTISAAVLERAEATFTSASNGISQAEVALSMAKRNSGDSTVSSPIDGVVTKKAKHVGESVTMMPPTVVMVVQDQSVIELRARIPEAALKTIREGQTITAHFSALELARSATVVRIQPTVDAQTRTIEIVADVANADNLLRPGMYVEVELTPPAAEVAAAPAAAGKEQPVASAKRKRSPTAGAKL
ncbi:efflux RND transporter periplasmic adaptor subunit [Nannocystis bainbridge]|uniref:Efflux RND transporter periplasmic adaptor subunit n=1 Tax=Nannocystis bainbridge TaxID=2995303 RepID=A0ABT5DWS5_9BACT|nr:efflux RND transporter periplasmic adaptor subunit [Nannocystis bainbridge]MDC0718094.1 efflux RND transporter periplasmic adaptor subunit [Nannocystis bainbridge]